MQPAELHFVHGVWAGLGWSRWFCGSRRRKLFTLGCLFVYLSMGAWGSYTVHLVLSGYIFMRVYLFLLHSSVVLV